MIALAKEHWLGVMLNSQGRLIQTLGQSAEVSQMRLAFAHASDTSTADFQARAEHNRESPPSDNTVLRREVGREVQPILPGALSKRGSFRASHVVDEQC